MIANKESLQHHRRAMLRSLEAARAYAEAGQYTQTDKATAVAAQHAAIATEIRAMLEESK